MILESIERTAVHEASHVVAALAAGVRVIGVDVLPRDTSRGRTYLAEKISTYTLPARLSVALAGEVGAHLLDAGLRAPARPARLAPAIWGAVSVVDFDRLALARAGHVLEGESPSDAEHVRAARPSARDMVAAWDATERVLRERWSAVHRIAFELMADGVLEEGRLLEIYRK